MLGFGMNLTHSLPFPILFDLTTSKDHFALTSIIELLLLAQVHFVHVFVYTWKPWVTH